MPIRIKEIAFVYHVVTDIPRARKFYEGALGLKPGLQLEFAPGVWWIEYDIAGVALTISNGRPGPPTSSLTLEVDDLDQALAAAREAWLKPSIELTEFPPCRMFAVKDPDGNEICLHQRKAG